MLRIPPGGRASAPLVSAHPLSHGSLARALGGVRVAFTGDDDIVRRALESRMGGLPAADPEIAHVRIVMERSSSIAELNEMGKAQRGRAVYDPPVGQVLYDDADDLLSIFMPDRVLASCSPRAGTAHITFGASDPTGCWLAAYPVLNLCLVELLRRHGLFNLHAAAVARGRRGLLMAGRSGAGKSTLTLALLRSGLAMLGDDTCFLRPRDDGLVIVGFPDEVDVADDSVRFFPELEFLLQESKRPGSSKRQLRAERAYDVEITAECSPAAVVLPLISDAITSTLQPIDAAEALMELMPSVLLTHPASTQAHLDVIGDLVRHVPCFRLRTGRDLDAIPSLLSKLL